MNLNQTLLADRQKMYNRISLTQQEQRDELIRQILWANASIARN